MGRALKVLLGLVVGALVGYILLRLGRTEGMYGYLGCAATGAVVGLICGRAPWKADTIWTPVLKMVFGMIVGAGLFALGSRFLPPLQITVEGLPGQVGLRGAGILAPVIGLLYGLFVEVDDGGSPERDKNRKDKPTRRPSV
ncbi:MAG: hypothetical protein RMK29_11680 [Myxococcales bacterium]|nr:hypothetical protein [Myxococcota bacterium]MDW8282368.1 hypothetical protein [Myxococcales bacterium]